MTASASVHLPGLLASLGPTLDHYGYLAVAGLVFLEDFGVPVPGETVLIAAAVYAGAGRLNPVLVATIGFLAAVLGDNLGFLIGHLVERRLILRVGRFVGLTSERLERAERFFERQGGKIIIIARFVEGLRQANGIVAGLVGMRWLTFLFYNAIGAALWVGCWVTLGVTAGNHIDTIYHMISTYSYVALGAIVLAIIAMVVVHRRRRAHGRKETSDQGSETREH